MAPRAGAAVGRSGPATGGGAFLAPSLAALAAAITSLFPVAAASAERNSPLPSLP